MDDAIEILKILRESNVLFLLFIIIPIVLLIGSWLMGNSINREMLGEEYLKESFNVFKILLIFYFGAILLVVLFIYVVK